MAQTYTITLTDYNLLAGYASSGPDSGDSARITALIILALTLRFPAGCQSALA